VKEDFPTSSLSKAFAIVLLSRGRITSEACCISLSVITSGNYKRQTSRYQQIRMAKYCTWSLKQFTDQYGGQYITFALYDYNLFNQELLTIDPTNKQTW